MLHSNLYASKVPRVFYKSLLKSIYKTCSEFYKIGPIGDVDVDLSLGVQLNLLTLSSL